MAEPNGRQDQSDLLAARLAVGSVAIAYALAALGAWFVNLGITIGCGLGAGLSFFSAQNFGLLGRLQFRHPYLRRIPKRTPWEVFRFSTYVTLAVSLLASIVFGQAFQIAELSKELSRQEIRSLKPNQKHRMERMLQLGPTEHYTFQINSAQNCDECEQFAEELRKFISAIPGWTADGGTVMFSDGHLGRGIWLISRSDEKDSAPVNKIDKAFADAGIRLLRYTEEQFQKGEFVIVVARKDS